MEMGKCSVWLVSISGSHWVRSGDIFDCHGCGGASGILVGRNQECTEQRNNTQKNNAVKKNVNSAKVENPCYKARL